MVPRISRGGSSFKGAFQYYMHDPDADTRERIEWTHTRNMLTDDPDKAWKVMAYTAKSQQRLKEASGQVATGRKAEKPVLAYSLSWHPSHDPDRDHMLETAMESIRTLGLEEHEAVVIAHRDTPHRHVHVVVNRIHPITGLVAKSSHSYRKLSDFAHHYQKENDMEHCPQREENRRKREEGRKTRYRDPAIAKAWENSDCGASFASALEEQGYRLAQGRKRLVVVDPNGRAHNPVRHLEGVKAKDFAERLSDLDQTALPDATEIAREAEEGRRSRDANAERKAKLSEEFNRSSKKEREHAKDRFNEAATWQDPTAKREREPVVDDEREERSPKPDTQSEPSLKELFDAKLSKLSTERKLQELRTQNELKEYYRLDEQRERIAELRRSVENASWWRKLFKLTRRDERELSELRSSFDDARSRYNERLDGLRAEFAKAEEKLRQEYGQAKMPEPSRRDEERQRRVEYIKRRQSEARNRSRGRSAASPSNDNG